MDNTNYTTEHRKCQHLMSEERHEIEVRLKDGWSIYRIAKHLCRPYNTIKNEIKRGTVSLYNGNVKRYKADEGKRVYLEHRENCRRQYRCLDTAQFLRYVVENFKSEREWSLDASYGKALESGEFRRDEIVCTKTLYNYVDLGLLPIKNIDLPEKLHRNTKAKRVHENKKIIGRSIEERPEIANSRTKFGHWEIDTVIGKKDENEPCVLTLVERMTRMCIWVKAKNHTAEAITEALQQIMSQFADRKDQVFKNDQVLYFQHIPEALLELRQSTNDFGIIPLPKFSADQTDYITPITHYATTFTAIPKTANDIERSAIVLDLLAAEGYYEVMPELYDTVLGVKYVRDDASAKMLDIIFDNRTYDIGNICNFGDVAYNVHAVYYKNPDSLVSKLESTKSPAEKALGKMIDQIRENVK